MIKTIIKNIINKSFGILFNNKEIPFWEKMIVMLLLIVINVYLLVCCLN